MIIKNLPVVVYDIECFPNVFSITCIHTELNKKIVITCSEGTSDAIYFSSKGMPTVIMNPIGDYPHCPNEYVNKDSLLTFYNIIVEFINESM